MIPPISNVVPVPSVVRFGATERQRQIPAADEMLPHFMNIVELRSLRIIGFESLLRLRSGSSSPIDLFADAARQGRTTDLDLNAVDATLRDACNLPGRVFLNVDPATLRHPADLQSVLSRYQAQGFALDRLTLEITEHSSFRPGGRTMSFLRTLRLAGVEIALDDVDAGQSHLAFIADIRPRYLKLSMATGSILSKSAEARALAARTVALANAHRAAVIIEGIESAQDMALAEQIGASYGQGYYFGRPEPAAAITGERLAA